MNSVNLKEFMRTAFWNDKEYLEAMHIEPGYLSAIRRMIWSYFTTVPKDYDGFKLIYEIKSDGNRADLCLTIIDLYWNEVEAQFQLNLDR